MKEAGYRFKVIPSKVDERYPKGLKPYQIVTTLARKKAVDVAKKYPGDFVLGADTVVFIHGKVIGKPRDEAHGRQILKKLSGAWQKVYTGVALSWKGGEEFEGRLCRESGQNARFVGRRN